MTQPNKKSGFTLIELSIVLVIIGLIVGGVLVGQDLIRAAEIRATVSQVERFDAAANTFRGRFNGLPGDIANPATFGLVDTGINLAAIANNGLINRLAGGPGDGDDYAVEATAFYAHLAQANLITEPITQTTFAAADIDDITAVAPPSRVGRGTRILVGEAQALNHYIVTSGAVTNGTFAFAANAEIPVEDALQIDTKLDDGLPGQGRVVAVTDFLTVDAGAAAAADNCVDTTPAAPNPDTYNMSTPAFQDDTECTLRIRTSF